MKWENLTAPDFGKAVKETKGVCVIPISCIEKHGEHLPLGTDMFAGKALAEKAAEIEPAIVFPSYYFGQINEARCFPGTIAINPRLMYDLLENVCEEASRNGLKKIAILNSHGGNTSFLMHFMHMMTLEKERDFTVYLISLDHYWFGTTNEQEYKDSLESEQDGHAGETETSVIMALHEHLVKKEDLPDDWGRPQKKLEHLGGVVTGIGWYSNYPEHYAGDGSYGTVEKGEKILDLFIPKIVEALKKIKEDTATQELVKEFHVRVGKLSE